MALGVRWLKFNAVGIAGIFVQLAALAFFAKVLHWNYLVATAFAVEAAVLHNFCWHIVWTWRDRALSGPALLHALWRFHLGNGLISIAANLLLMRLLAGALHMPLLLANLISIGITSIANFLVGEFWVFTARRP